MKPALLVILALAHSALAEPGALTIPRVSTPPRLEDYLGTAPPGGAITDFRQREPGDGIPASRKTSAWVSYDDDNLYAVFLCEDDRAKIRAHMAKREDFSADDSVSLYLDTFRDRQRAYVFTVNPLGIQQEGVLTEGRKKVDYQFDTVWHSEGHLIDNGFAVRLAIPLKSLRFSAQSSQTWGIALGRWIARENEADFWPHISSRRHSFVQQLAPLEGLENISPGRNIQLIPYLAFGRARLLSSRPAGYRTENDVRPGADAKIVFRDAFTLDLAANPDFSQVESDDPQVTLNKRFEVFFPEKRPFFLENAGYFQTPLNLFFSRRVADPEFGARLTGKAGPWALGILAADDRAPGQRLRAEDRYFGRRTANGVVRVQREFGRDSRIGALATTRDFGPVFNHVVSLDARLKLNPNWFLSGQAVRSYDRRLDGRTRSGPAYFADLAHSGRHFNYSGNYTDFSPDFRSELGFIRRVDIRQAEQYAGYSWKPEGWNVVSFGPAVTALANWDRRGRLQDWYWNGEFTLDFTGPTELKVSRFEAYELYLERGFRNSRSAMSFYTGALKWLFVYGSFGFGRQVNYSPARGVAPFLGHGTDGSFGFALRPGARLRIDQYYYYSRLGRVFNNHLVRTKANYQFSRALSARVIFDYYGVLPNTALINQDKFKRASADILLTYLLNPGTALYVGYTDRYDNVALTQGRVIPTISPETSTARQLFVKLSYLLRF